MTLDVKRLRRAAHRVGIDWLLQGEPLDYVQMLADEYEALDEEQVVPDRISYRTIFDRIERHMQRDASTPEQDR